MENVKKKERENGNDRSEENRIVMKRRKKIYEAE